MNLCKNKTVKQIICSFLAAALVTLIIAVAGVLNRVDSMAQDAWYQSPKALDGSIIVIGIDNKSLDELYRKIGRIDQSFWDELIGLKVEFPELNKKYDGLDTIVGFPNAVLPPEINEQWKAAFTGSPEVKRFEEMLGEPPPLP